MRHEQPSYQRYFHWYYHRLYNDCSASGRPTRAVKTEWNTMLWSAKTIKLHRRTIRLIKANGITIALPVVVSATTIKCCVPWAQKFTKFTQAAMSAIVESAFAGVTAPEHFIDGGGSAQTKCDSDQQCGRFLVCCHFVPLPLCYVVLFTLLRHAFDYFLKSELITS